MASLYERDGAWYARYKDEHGAWKHKVLQARSKGDAKRLLMDLEIEVEAKRKVLKLAGDNATWTVNELLGWCLQTYWAKASNKAALESFLNTHFGPSDLGKMAMLDVMPGHVERFLQTRDSV